MKTGPPAWAVDASIVFALVYLAGSLELVEPFERYLVPETSALPPRLFGGMVCAPATLGAGAH